ncbi:MAG: peptidylprolyl isomerase [Rhodospirillales bacterium]|nr:peptidylprolyl isomerase [Rhodospirillales bacterium]
MQVSKGTVVTLTYQVRDMDGNMVDQGADPISYVHGGKDINVGLFPRLQEELEGKEVGDSIEVELDPLEAFGEYDDELVMEEDIELFPEGVEVGMVLELEQDDGGRQLFQVAEVNEDSITVDGNHPLAGVSLIFSGTVQNVRQASDKEMKSSVPEV